MFPGETAPSWIIAVGVFLFTVSLWGVFVAKSLFGIPTGGEVSCFEDEVIVWSGQTNSHSICLPLDDLWLAQEIQRE
jgi:hypothetical protein